MIKQYLTYQEFLNEGLSSSRKAFLNTGKIGPEDFERLTSLDSTPTKKYLDSICRFYLEGHSEQDIKTYIDKFHTLGSNLPKKDINLYSFEELKSNLDGYTSKNQKDKAITKDINVVYEDERFFIVRPDTFEQSAKYGRGTKWCITATDGTGKYTWDSYRRLGINFYFITDKSLPSTDPLYKVCIAVDEDGNVQRRENSTVDSLNRGIDGNDYIKKNSLSRKIFNLKLIDLSNFENWSINISRLKNGTYYGNLVEAPKDIKEFRGFKELFGFEIERIGDGTLDFNGCTSLTSVSNLPEWIEYDLSFEGCTSLSVISNFPKYVGHDLDFTGCTSLKSLPNIPENIGGNLYFTKCTSLKSIGRITMVGWTLSFENCKSLKSVSNLPEYIRGNLSFNGCTSLKRIGNMPRVVKGRISTEDCPFFEGMSEKQIRQVYNIRLW